MKCRMFALSLALGALLCLAPSAAALEPQPEAPAPDAAEPAGQALAEEVTKEVTVTVEVPILPEKPPIQISYTTPEEIGFAWEEDGIQGIRVTGAEDVLHGLACLLGQGSHAAHQGGFPTAALSDQSQHLTPLNKKRNAMQDLCFSFLCQKSAPVMVIGNTKPFHLQDMLF